MAKQKDTPEDVLLLYLYLCGHSVFVEEPQAVAILASITHTLPESTLSMVPGEFRTALYNMRSKGIEKDGIAILSPP